METSGRGKKKWEGEKRSGMGRRHREAGEEEMGGAGRRKSEEGAWNHVPGFGFLFVY